jgi:hypothetical protein
VGLTVGKSVEASAKYQVLAQPARHSFRQAVFRIAAAYQEARSPLRGERMAEHRVKPSVDTFHVDELWRNRISEDFWFVIAGLMHRAHDCGDVAHPTRFGCLHGWSPKQ